MEISCCIKGPVRQLAKTTALLPKGAVPRSLLIWLFSIFPHFRIIFPFAYAAVVVTFTLSPLSAFLLKLPVTVSPSQAFMKFPASVSAMNTALPSSPSQGFSILKTQFPLEELSSLQQSLLQL